MRFFRTLLAVATLFVPAFAAAGGLRFVEVQKNGVGGVDGLVEPLGVAVSPDGRSVYATSFDGGTVSVFRRDPRTGVLSFLEGNQGGGTRAPAGHTHGPGGGHHGQGGPGLEHPMGLTLSPDGHHVYVASTGNDAVTVFSRDSASGTLTFVQSVRDGVDGVDGLGSARTVVVSPDGLNVYAGGPKRAAIAVFARDGFTGALRFVKVERNGLDGVDGLAGLADIVVTPGGEHVIAAANGYSTLAVFVRDPMTGTLSFRQLVRDGVDGVDGLGSVRGLAISPDGSYVYTASPSDSAVAVFRRDPTTGWLGLVAVERNGVGGVRGLSFPTKVVVSPDGKMLYAAANGDNAVSTFARDATTGRLTYMESQTNGENGVEGLMGAFWVAPSSDSRNLYVVGLDGNAVAVFAASAKHRGPVAWRVEVLIAMVLCALLAARASYRRRARRAIY
jgi:6-phosphogluconolactonase (cycloisomerase 2 family)